MQELERVGEHHQHQQEDAGENHPAENLKGEVDLEEGGRGHVHDPTREFTDIH